MLTLLEIIITKTPPSFNVLIVNFTGRDFGIIFSIFVMNCKYVDKTAPSCYNITKQTQNKLKQNKQKAGTEHEHEHEQTKL